MAMKRAELKGVMMVGTMDLTAEMMAASTDEMRVEKMAVYLFAWKVGVTVLLLVVKSAIRRCPQLE